MNKKTLIIIGSIAGVLALCLCVVAVVAIGGLRQAGEILKTLPTATVEVAAINTPEPILPVETAAPVLPTEAIEETVPTVEPAAVEIDVDEARSAANEMILQLAKREYDAAVSLTDARLRSDASTAETLRDMVEEKGLDPVHWEWLNIDQNAEKQEVYLEGVVNLADDRRGAITAHVMMEDDAWKVFFLDLNTQGKSVDPGAYSQWNEQREKEEVAFAKAEADLFFFDWIDEDYESAYKYSAQALRDQVGAPEKLGEVLKSVGAFPDTWTWDSYEIVELEDQERPVISLTGTMQYSDGKEGPATVQLDWEEGNWAVRYFNVEAK